MQTSQTSGGFTVIIPNSYLSSNQDTNQFLV